MLKRRDSWVANQRLMVLMDNGRTPGLQISWPGFRGSCCMVPMESRQKEDEEVSSQATTLQFGSPGKSRWEEYVCLGYPHCENFDCDLCENPSETEVEDVKEDGGTPHHLGARSTSRTKCGRTTCAGNGKKPTTPSSARERAGAAVAAVPLQRRIVRQRRRRRARKRSLAPV